MDSNTAITLTNAYKNVVKERETRKKPFRPINEVINDFIKGLIGLSSLSSYHIFHGLDRIPSAYGL